MYGAARERIPSPLGHAHHYEQIARENPAFTLALMGKRCGAKTEVNWCLEKCQDLSVWQMTREILQDLGASIYYAPNVSTANALRVPRGILRNPVLLSDVRVFGNTREPGDAIMLEPGEGVVMWTGGCGAILAEHETTCVAHAGWRSLVDDDRALNRACAWRLNESVVETVVRSARNLRNPRGMRVWLRMFISHEALRFPLERGEWAEVNRRRLEYVVNRWGAQCVDCTGEDYGIKLPVLAAAQFYELGVRDIDLAHSAIEPEAPVWQDGTKGAPRNLTVVVRRDTL